jgi:4-oxalocrotonate tautomerase
MKMPVITIKVSASRSIELTNKIAGMVSSLTQRILHKDPALTAIVIEYVEPEDWVVGGLSLSRQRKGSVYLDIKITDETNTKAEKAQYIRETFAGFQEILGDLHEESYIYVQDVRAAAYGYGGRTQEHRFHHPT